MLSQICTSRLYLKVVLALKSVVVELGEVQVLKHFWLRLLRETHVGAGKLTVHSLRVALAHVHSGRE